MTVRRYVWVVAALLALACLAAAPAQAGYDGYALKETLNVYSNSPDGVWTSSIPAGCKVKIQASQYCIVDYFNHDPNLPRYADAQYVSNGPIGGDPFEQWNPYSVPPWGAFLWINDYAPDWGPFNEWHTYCIELCGTGQPLHLWFKDSDYSNNICHIVVKIYCEAPQCCGRTKGFWQSPNGQKLFGSDDLALMQSLCLRRWNGTDFDPTSYEHFRYWIKEANAVNMAYMLSAQLAAMALNINNGLVGEDCCVYAPCLKNWTGSEVVPIGDVVELANEALCADGYTPSGDSNRYYQELLKNVLDQANNNMIWVACADGDAD